MTKKSFFTLIVSILLFVGGCQRDDKNTIIKIEPSDIKLDVGQMIELKLTLKNVKADELLWESSAPSVAKVYKGKVSALAVGKATIKVSAKGVSSFVNVEVKFNDANFVVFDDVNLKKLLIDKYPFIDSDKDGNISYAEAQKITRIDFSFAQKEDIKIEQRIEKLGGLQAFTELTHLFLKNQFVKDATPIQNLVKLKVLHLGGNELSTIDVGNLVRLDSLFLFGNINITSLDLSKNKSLREVFLQNMGIKSLDFSQCKNLEKAYINNGETLESLTIGSLPKLERLDAVKQKLTSIVVKDLPSLKEIHLDHNRINSIILKNLPELNRLNVYANNLSSIDLSDLPKLMFFFSQENASLENLNFEKNPMLFQVILSKTAVTDISFVKNPIVRNIEIENCTKLKTIDFQNGAFSDEAEYLVKEGNSSLTTVYADSGDEVDLLKKIFKSMPQVTVTSK